MPIASEDNRKVTHTASVIVTVFMTGTFAAVWMLFYNAVVFRTHRELGAVCVVSTWLILYTKFAQIYRSFKIASSAIGEITFSQFLSVGVADFMVYVAGCLIARRYINVLPGAVAVMVQILIGFGWATKSKQYFLANIGPRECLLLYDADISDAERVRGREFSAKLENSYGHLFHIVESYPLTDEFDEACAIIAQYPIIFVYNIGLEKRSKVVNYSVNTGKRIYVTPTVEDIIARGYEVKHFIDTPLMSYNGSYKNNQTYFGKRALDILFSLLMLAVASPIMLVTAIAIKLEDGGDIFFRQARCTQGGKVFSILKFRSMVMDAEKDGKPRPCVAGDLRVTRVGKIIRTTRIDELPQIFNILRGDLSLVGPRPERVEHVDLYTKDLPEFSYRLRVKGGLTGYAQIYGKYNTSARDKLLLDLLYIEQQSFLLDAKILFLTVKIMFTPESTEGFDENIAAIISKQESVHDA